jgi:GT2 family glycosyltransferase
MKPLRVSIVIPTYQRGDILADTIAMALAQDYPDFEVIVVDQSLETPPAVRELIAASADCPLRYMRLTTPNLPGARNAGVLAATGEVIVFIDDDVVIGPDFLASYARVFEDPAVGGAMGMTLAPGGRDPDLDAIDRQFTVQKRFPDGTAQVLWLVGCNCAYRRKAILEAGMSDERFTGSAWSEDVDLSVRVRHLGCMFLYDPQVRLIHLALQSGGCANRTPADEEKRDEHRYRLHLYMALKNRAIFGAGVTLSIIWRTYRNYAFNLPLLKAGRKLFGRQMLFVKVLLDAVRMAAQARDAATRGEVSRVL